MEPGIVTRLVQAIPALIMLLIFAAPFIFVIWFIFGGWKKLVKLAMKIRNAVRDETKKYK